MKSKKNSISPPFRWAGGKQDLLKTITNKLNRAPESNGYHELFAGASSIFFNLKNVKRATLSDINQELILTLQAIKDSPVELMLELDKLNHLKDRAGFLEVRAWDRQETFKSLSDIQRAARFLFLQALGYNGLWRENLSGQYNTSYGQNDQKSLYTESIIMTCHEKLSNVEIVHSPFTDRFDFIEKGDRVYLDPPYIPVTSSKFNYSGGGFSHDDQMKLKEGLHIISEIGAHFVLSNSDCAATRALYKEFKIRTVSTRRNIGKTTASRKKVTEVLVSNY
ncbi:Site-specific DNA-methyltransferase (adenine-specific) [Vibrio chagasii]|nr:Site-specific DNA-methyltransferase (adenine-specific) [Vibrio chagasii]